MDFGRIARELDIEEHEYIDLLRLFLKTSRSNLGSLNAAIAAGKAEDVAAAAHRIKGAALNLSLADAAGFARRIESEARGGELSAAAPTFRKLEEAVDALAALLEPQKE